MTVRSLHDFLARLRCHFAAVDTVQVHDAELLERFVRSKDEAAFELIVWRHGPMVLHVCRRIVREPHGADDAFQATFLTLVRKAGTISRRSSLPAWLHRVALRAAQRVRIRTPLTTEGLVDLPDPREPQEVREGFEILDAEVSRLEEKYRVPLILCHLEGKTLAEAGRIMGCPRGTVAVRLARARQRLRSRLARRGLNLALVLGALVTRREPLSAALVHETLRAARIFAGLAGVLSPSLVALTEGVLRAMFLSKWQGVAMILALLVVLGGGAGWVTFHTNARENTEGVLEIGEAEETPQKKDKAPSVEKDRENALKVGIRRLESAIRELSEAEARLEKIEEQILRELIDARTQVDQKDFVVSELSAQTGPIQGLQALRENEEKIEALARNRSAKEEQLHRLQMTRSADHPETKSTKNDLENTIKSLELSRQEYERLLSAHKEEWKKTHAILVKKARAERIEAQERLHLLETRSSRRRDAAHRDVDLAAERVRRAREIVRETEEGFAPVGESQEQKIDRLTRELLELRREVKRLSEQAKPR